MLFSIHESQYDFYRSYSWYNCVAVDLGIVSCSSDFAFNENSHAPLDSWLSVEHLCLSSGLDDHLEDGENAAAHPQRDLAAHLRDELRRRHRHHVPNDGVLEVYVEDVDDDGLLEGVPLGVVRGEVACLGRRKLRVAHRALVLSVLTDRTALLPAIQ